MPDVCTLSQSWGGHRFDSLAPWGYAPVDRADGLLHLPSMNHGKVFGGFSVKISLEKITDKFRFQS
jgi:hypothetical protein